MLASNGNGQHLNNAKLEEVIIRFQRTGDASSLGEIVALSQQRALTLIRFNGTTSYRSEVELLSDINFKLMRSVRNFDPNKGSAFTFVSKIIDSSLRTSVSVVRKNWARHVELDEAIASTLHTNGEKDHQEVLEDLTHRIMSGVKTTLSDEAEVSAQRWLIESFCQEGFASKRYVCTNHAASVFGLKPERAREIFDLSMLETRRVVFDVLPPQPTIAAARLAGTRSAWMLRYAPLLDADEFSKFVTLTKGLNAFIVVLIAPKTRSRRLDRNPTVSRQNLLWILHGQPDARALFQ